MNKTTLIALADAVASHNDTQTPRERFTEKQIAVLADFCASQNPAFKRGRWLDYIAGKCGPNGGPVK